MPQCHYSYSGSVLQYAITKLIINATESSSHNTHSSCNSWWRWKEDKDEDEDEDDDEDEDSWW